MHFIFASKIFSNLLFYLCFIIVYIVGLIHGDFDQFERNKVLSEFKRGDYSILVATDVAGISKFRYENLFSSNFSSTTTLIAISAEP